MTSPSREPVAPRSTLLAIDSSSAQGAIALFDGVHLATRTWAADRSHPTTFLAEIHHLLASASIEASDLAAIAVAIGPGAFTALRAGIGIAKGFHLALGVPLIGVSTLEATALPFATSNRRIVATLGAGRGRLLWAHYKSHDGQLAEVQAARNGTASELAAELAAMEPVIVAGEVDAVQAAELLAIGQALLPPESLRYRQPAALAQIGWQRWQAGDVDDPIGLEPVYLAR